MKIGVVKERAPNERRVALVPDALKPLLAAGAEILVEEDAGEARRYPTGCIRTPARQSSSAMSCIATPT